MGPYGETTVSSGPGPSRLLEADCLNVGGSPRPRRVRSVSSKNGVVLAVLVGFETKGREGSEDLYLSSIPMTDFTVVIFTQPVVLLTETLPISSLISKCVVYK